MTLDADRHETACLVALLQAQPHGLSWGDIAAEVLQRGNASSVWHEQQPADLLGTSDKAIEDALREIERWISDGTRILTINDPEYPERLRAIHQAPPILFARGDVRVDDRAV